MKYLITPFLVTTVLAMLSACGGDGGSGDKASSNNQQLRKSNSDSADGISGDVANVNHHYNGDMRYTAAGTEMRRNLKVVSRDSDDSYWEIRSLTPQTGSYSCNDGELELILQRDGETPLRSENCELTVSQANDEYIKGYFQANLIGFGKQAGNPAEGVFNIELARVIPDLDRDGLSDADDNCPFDSNIDQSDQNGNAIGDVCETESNG
jgi:hypothetical protein